MGTSSSDRANDDPAEDVILAPDKLPLHNLSDRHSGLTFAIAESYTEAARVCLDRHHSPPVDIAIKNADDNHAATVEWVPPDNRTRGAWANETDATEDGAYACVLAALELTSGLVAVRRAETKTGADYYVAAPGAGANDLEECLRLEVSGVDKGSEAAVMQRLNAKLEQAAAGASNLPAIAGVVGFLARLIALQPLQER